jgi:hypothetical protein
MTQAVKTEVVKLGESMTDEQREELNKTLEEVKKAQAEKGSDDAEEEQEEEKEKKPCPKCGFFEGAIPPPKEDSEEYMRSILGGRRFVKSYDLMKGQINVVFTTVDTESSERMNKVIAELSTLEDPTLFHSYLIKLQMVYQLQSYKVGEKEDKFVGSNASNLEEAEKQFTERFGGLDEGVIGMFTRTLNSFMTLKKKLIDNCFDETFYKGAGPF